MIARREFLDRGADHQDFANKLVADNEPRPPSLLVSSIS